MAYVFSTERYSGAVAATNLVVALPDHAVNDVIVMIATLESSTLATGTGTTGTWTSIGNTTSTNATGSCFYRRMTTNAETVSITTTSLGYSVIFICCRDVDVTTAIDVTSNFSNNNTASPAPVNVSITSVTANALILYAVGMAQIAGAIHSPPGFMTLGSFDSTGTSATTRGNQGNCWYIQRTAGAVPVPTWQSNFSGDYIRYTIALRPLSGGRIPPYIDDTVAPASALAGCHHSATLNFGNGNVTTSATMSPSVAINGKTVTGSLATDANSADFGINPYSQSIGNASAVAAATTLIGPNIAFATARNCSTGIILGSHIANTPKVAAFGLGNQNQGGGVIRIASGASNWCAYQVLSRDSTPLAEGRYVWGVQAGYTGTSYGTPGTAVTTTAITSLQTLANFPVFAGILFASEIYHVTAQVVAGGTSTNPVDTAGMVSIGKSFRLPVIQQQGGSGLISFAPIQVGGGDDVNFQINGGILQFPSRYNANTYELNWHAADGAVGISYNGNTGDVIKHTNSLITSKTPFYWEIHTASTNAATWDFTGLSLYNGVVTLNSVANGAYNRIVYTACQQITAVGVTSSSCAFDSNNIITLTGNTIDGPTFTRNTIVNLLDSTLSEFGFSLLQTQTSSINTNTGTMLIDGEFDTTLVTAGNAVISTTTPQYSNILASIVSTGSGSSGHLLEVKLPTRVLPVRVATVANGVLATAFANGQTVDGVTLATGNRILIKNQTSQLENGIYTVSVIGVPIRVTEMDAWTEVPNITVAVTLGTANIGTAWTCTSAAGGVINVSSVVFANKPQYTATLDCLVGTTAAGTLATSFAAGQAVDGVTLATGNRILIKNQAAPADNGIYIVNATGAPTRCACGDTLYKLIVATTQITSGTVNIGSTWYCTNVAGGVLGTTSITFALENRYGVLVSTTAAGTLSTSFANGQVVDGVTLATGNRILIKNQASALENGVYTVNVSGVPTRAILQNTWGGLYDNIIYTIAGTANAGASFRCTAGAGGTLETTAITYIPFLTTTGVVAATTTNGTLATSFITTSVIDGVVLLTGDRLLIKNQTNPAENGIYTVGAGAPTRAADMNTWLEVPDIIVRVGGGTVNATSYWDCTSVAGGTLETTPIIFAEYNVISLNNIVTTAYGATDTTSAAIYNNTGGRLTLNLINGSTTPTVRNGYGATTIVNTAVPLTITVIDANNTPLDDVNIAIYKKPFSTNDSAILTPTNTNGSGQVVASHNYVGDQLVSVRARRNTSGGTRYLPQDITGTITASGYSVTITMTVDPNTV